MELDEIRRELAVCEGRLEAGIRLNRKVLETIRLREVRGAMARWRAFTGLHVVAWMVAVLALGSFIAGSVREPRFLASGMALAIYALGNMLALGRQAWLGSDTTDGPVVEVQRRIARLRLERLRYLRWSVGVGAALWVPALMVAVRAASGADLYRVMGVPWIVSNVVLGAAAVPGFVFLCARFFGDLQLMHQVVDDLAGRNLRSALVALAEVEEFAGSGQ